LSLIHDDKLDILFYLEQNPILPVQGRQY
jgi:hypothetical protein